MTVVPAGFTEVGAVWLGTSRFDAQSSISTQSRRNPRIADNLVQTFFDDHLLHLSQTRSKVRRIVLGDILSIAVSGLPHFAFSRSEFVYSPFQIGLLFAQVILKALTPRHFDLFVLLLQPAAAIQVTRAVAWRRQNTKTFQRFPPEVPGARRVSERRNDQSFPLKTVKLG